MFNKQPKLGALVIYKNNDDKTPFTMAGIITKLYSDGSFDWICLHDTYPGSPYEPGSVHTFETFSGVPTKWQIIY